MTPMEILAAIFAMLVLIKLLFVAVNPKFWMKGVESILSKYVFTDKDVTPKCILDERTIYT